jgi:hypothetical protein
MFNNKRKEDMYSIISSMYDLKSKVTQESTNKKKAASNSCKKKQTVSTTLSSARPSPSRKPCSSFK